MFHHNPPARSATIEILKRAIFGGTFDPIHDGHLEVAREAIRQCGMDEVLFVPAATPPHKAASTPFAHRYRMVELACAGQPGFAVSRIEEHRQQSYSIITIEELKAAHPDDEFQFLIGADAFAELRTWFRWEDVVRAIDFIVVSRPGHPYEVPDGARVRRLDSLDLRVSSTHVRRMLENGFVYDLPDSVALYVLEHDLYGVGEAGMPTLETNRLRLRNIRPGDRDFLAALDTDPEVMRHIHDGPMSQAEADKWADFQVLHARQKNRHGKWIVELRSDGTRVGWVQLAKHGGWRRDDTQIGYQFAREHWGRGYGVEAVKCAVRWAFRQLYRDRVVALVRPANSRSIRLLEKIGFRKEKRHPMEKGDRNDFYVVTARRFPTGHRH